jgi:hypothetical protein
MFVRRLAKSVHAHGIVFIGNFQIKTNFMYDSIDIFLVSYICFLHARHLDNHTTKTTKVIQYGTGISDNHLMTANFKMLPTVFLYVWKIGNAIEMVLFPDLENIDGCTQKSMS